MISYIHQHGYVFQLFLLTAEFAEASGVIILIIGFNFSAFSACSAVRVLLGIVFINLCTTYLIHAETLSKRPHIIQQIGEPSRPLAIIHHTGTAVSYFGIRNESGQNNVGVRNIPGPDST